MYVGLFVRIECEISVKNQASKDESVQFMTSFREATHEKAMCEAHDRKMKSHTGLSSLWVFREKGHPAKYLWNILFGKKLSSFTKFFTHTINTIITHEL